PDPSVGLALNGGINSLCQKLFSLFPLAAGIAKRNSRIGAERQRLLFATESIGQTPQFAAMWLYQQMKAACIRYLIGRTVGCAFRTRASLSMLVSCLADR